MQEKIWKKKTGESILSEDNLLDIPKAKEEKKETP